MLRMMIVRWKVAAVAIVLGIGSAVPISAQVVLGRPADRSVHDFAGVLSAQAVPTLEGFHRELFEKTGVSIVVVTVATLNGEPAADFAVRVGDEWGVGRGGEDRGIVVAVAVEERTSSSRPDMVWKGTSPTGAWGRSSIVRCRRCDRATIRLGCRRSAPRWSRR